MTLADHLEQLQYGTTMSDNQEPMLTNNRNIAIQAIAKDIKELLPEKKEYFTQTVEGEAHIDGWNDAISDMEEALKEYFK